MKEFQTMSLSHFSLLLRQERIRCGWTQQEVADRLNIERITVTRWESGKAIPSLSLRIPLCHLFGKDMQEFFPVDTGSILEISASSSSDQLIVMNSEIDAIERRQRDLAHNDHVPQTYYQQSSLVGYQDDGELHVHGRSSDFNTEEHYLNVQLKYLEIQKNWIEYTIHIANQLIDVLDPTCDLGIRSLVLEECLTNLQKNRREDEHKFTLPTLESIRDTLELVKRYGVQKKDLSQEQGTFLKEDHVDTMGGKKTSLSSNFSGPISGVRVDSIQTERSPSILPDELENNVATLSVGTATLEPRLANFYDNFVPVREPSMFFGRSREVQLLYSTVTHRQCVSLVGTRRIGKSSLLRYLLNRDTQQKFGYEEALKKHIFILQSFSEFSLANESEDFFNKISSELISQCQGLFLLEVPEEKGAIGFRHLLYEMGNHGFHLVLLLDEFEQIGSNHSFDSSFFSFLRSLAERGYVSYITASRLPLHEIMQPSIGSPFFNIFRSVTIGALEREEALELIMLPSARVGLPYLPEEVDWILEKAGRHPFFLQVSCCYLLEEKSKLESGKSLDFELLEIKIYNELLPHFQSTWRYLSEGQQDNLKRVIQQANRPDQGHRVVNEMEEFSESELFRRYIYTTFHDEQADISVEELKKILEHYQEREFLAESVLAVTYYVKKRLDGNRARPYQIGTLVQDFLQEAFERMKPAGIRTDGSEVWRSYNILHFRYIHQQMATEYLGPKLGIGRRQYFRSLDRALKEMRRHLLELNNESFDF
jgi:transcriptional regulator with XRE-family HTH domain